jgi:hypothetical protein
MRLAIRCSACLTSAFCVACRTSLTGLVAVLVCATGLTPVPLSEDSSTLTESKQRHPNSACKTAHVHCCLQDKFDWAAGGVEAERLILSYGPCQFPTLGIIVQRAW